MNSVTGLSAALKLYGSDKIKERGQGSTLLREIISNRANLERLQDTASRDNGQGWIALFQCLFQAVLVEKKVVIKKIATDTSSGLAAAQLRLTDAASLVRFAAERSVHMIGRKPFNTLLLHMTALLVHDGRIFEPVAMSYIKTLRTLLSYPPHLEHVEEPLWRTLMTICWSAILGDRIPIEDGIAIWRDDPDNVSDDESDVDISAKFATVGSSSVLNEIVALVPILLSSSSAPLIPPPPAKIDESKPALGFSILRKIHRYISQVPGNGAVSIEILRALNILLGELELNCRQDFTAISLKIFPQLANMWTARNKGDLGVREHVMVALRTILPFITHHSVSDQEHKETVKEAMIRILDGLSKEATSRAPIKHLDLETLRFKAGGTKLPEGHSRPPFELMGVTAGFAFDASQALYWAAIELWADCCFHTYDNFNLPSSSAVSAGPSQPPASKRRRKDGGSLEKLLNLILGGNAQTRLLACQVTVFLIDKHWPKIHAEAKDTIRRRLLQLLDDDDTDLQSWAFIGLACFATVDGHLEALNRRTIPLTPANRQREHPVWEHVWAHAIRKTSVHALSRAASHAAEVMLHTGKVDKARCLRDIHQLLRNVDIQGPPIAFETVISFMIVCLDRVRADSGLYAANLEDKVIDWFSKTYSSEGHRKTVGPATPANFLNLLTHLCAFTPAGLEDVTVMEQLPDCPIVNRIVQEATTDPLRRLILDASMPAVPEVTSGQVPVAAGVSDIDSLAFLDGRPRKLSDILKAAMERTLQEWNDNSPSNRLNQIVTAERVRKSIDLVVLAFTFQAAIHANGLRPDASGCLHQASTLLSILLPHVRNLSESVPALLLAWRGFSPLYLAPQRYLELWPILLKPDRASGIRRDVLPTSRYASHFDDDEEGLSSFSESVLSILWSNEQTSAALEELVQTARHTLENVRTIKSGNAMALPAVDDEDFEPIRNAEGDTMPQSLEARVAQRATSSLLKTLVDLRLRGQKLRSPNGRAPKDVALVNTFVQCESAQFALLGFALCDAIQEGSLRLSIDIVDVILNEIEDRINTYGFKRDSELIRLTVMFLARTAAVWLSPESGLCENAIGVVKIFLEKVESGYPMSWQARLQLLLFIDEYLDYDPSFNTWLQMSDTEEADIIMGGDRPDAFGPVQYVLDSTSDLDARVRFRAVSSAAGVHYLPDMSMEWKNKAYFDLLGTQTSDTFSSDHFLTNLIWKLNTCIASASLRSGTIFHLYEVADYAPEFLVYLQPGLRAIAARLGLDSLQTLFRAHANIVVVNQLRHEQLPLRLPPEVYGCEKRKDFALLCLESVGAKILSELQLPHNAPFFKAVCDAAGVDEVQARMRHLPFAAAIAVAEAVNDVEVPDTAVVNGLGLEALNSLQQDDSLDVAKYLAQNGEMVIAGLFLLVDLATTNEEVATLLESLDTRGAGPSETFARLMVNDQYRMDTPPVLDPYTSVTSVLYAHHFFKTYFKSMSKRRMVFGAVIRLFHGLNSAYLVNEQRRYLRSIALLASLYSNEFAFPLILQEFLRNAIDLMPMDDVGQVALSMVQWGFERLQQAPKPPPELASLLMKLGSAFAKLQAKPHMQVVADDLDNWVASKAQSWHMSDAILPALETALVFWPQRWIDHFRVPDQHFLEVAEMAKMPNFRNTMALSGRLAKAAQGKTTRENKDAFLDATFWYLKQGLQQEQWNHDGAIAFLDLLHMVNGEVHAPSLNTINNLTGRTQIQDIAKKLEGRPHDALRIAILQKMLEQTASDDYTLRYTAYEVLRTTLPMIQPSIEALPENLREMTIFLVPATPASSSEEPVLESIIEASWIAKSRSHEVWAKDLALLLGSLASTTDGFYACLQPMLSAKGNAAMVLLPFLVQAVLICESHEGPELAPRRAAILSDHFAQVLQYPLASSQTVEAVIQIVLHLRTFKPLYATGELAYNHWLNIDPLVLSEAAGKCGAFASSLLFLEMAKDRDDVGNQDLDLSSPRIQKIMYDIYSNVEDPDGFYGIQNHNVMDSLHRRLDHEGQPLRALGYNLADVEATQSQASAAGPLIAALRNLHDLGFDTLAGSVMKSLKASSDTQNSSDPFFLELAWRMGDWDVPVTKELATTSTGRFYTALRAVHRERDYEVARSVVDDAIRSEMANLQQIGVERMTEIKKTSLNLLCLRDVERWISVPMQKALEQDDFEGGLLNSFVQLDPSFEFNNAERLSATRLSLIRSARTRESKNLFGDLVSLQAEGLMKLENVCQLRMSELARKEGNLQAAVNAITAVRKIERGMGSPSDAAQEEFSQVLWAQGEHALAIQHVDSILNPLKLLADEKGRKGLPSITPRHAILLSRKAHWYWLAKLKSAEEIRSTARRAMDLATTARATMEEQAQMAHDFAVFTDRYYSVLAKSPELERLKSYVDRRQGEYKALEQSMYSTPPGSRRGTVQPPTDAIKPDKLLEEESQAKAEMEAELLRYLVYALQCYAVALSYSDKFDDSVTRLCSLWLEHDKDEEANEKFAPRLKAVPTHKFLFHSPQLSAKLFRPAHPTQFNSLLNNLVLRIAQDHPYHILYQIITLSANAAPPSRSSRAKSAPPPSSDGRGSAAADILAAIKADKGRPVARAAVSAMNSFASAAVQWCYTEHKTSSGDRPKPGMQISAPESSPLMQCRGLKIPVPTVPPPVDLTLQYEGIITIDRYRRTFQLAGGLHRPSIMTCIDSLGQAHVQLFKGEDDVRQDAVMEQVFEMTNRLLQRDRRTSIRNLKFRTYHVVHLANRSGIIQFVGNTIAIGDWLKPAHTRYRKGIDISADMFRTNLASRQEKDWTSPKITEIWKEQMTQFHPVMRHFFTERRREPLAWFTMRLNYARSVAVTSIVGWMIGLGDRHCSNILIDKVTGELVHIDFGIVFEEGRKLRIPEKVPFRLTNDIVDGLGVTGVEGTFRQCSEHTLRVLRESSELVFTVLEVFKHDPLHNWVGDPSKMRRAGGGQAQAVHASAGQDKAERVLSAIRLKLGPELSVEYRVNQLIQEARNEEYLSKIFVGWQSWL